MPRKKSDWVDAIESTSDLPPWVKRVLLAYADKMNATRVTSVPRSKIAETLGIAERNVTKALTIAKRRGWLIVLSPGERGLTAVYQGTFGSPKTMGDMRDPMSQHVDVSEEGPANDCSEKVGSRHIERSDDHDNVIYLNDHRQEASLSDDTLMMSKAQFERIIRDTIKDAAAWYGSGQITRHTIEGDSNHG